MKRKIYEDREMSWLKFNERVLEEAEDKNNPLCERLSFLSIFAGNMDEFVMVRIGAISEGFKSEKKKNKSDINCKKQLKLIFAKQRQLLKHKEYVYKKLMKELRHYGVEELHFGDLNEDEKYFIWRFYEEEIRPFISPQVVGKRQPFPFLKNGEIYAVVELQTKSGSNKIGIVPCNSTVLDRVIPVSENGRRFMLVEEVILHFTREIFRKYYVKKKSLIKVIRSAEIDIDDTLSDDETDYRKAMENAIKTRSRLCPLKIEFSRAMDDSFVRKICDYLELEKNQVFQTRVPLDMTFLSGMRDLLRNNSELFYKPRSPRQPEMVNRFDAMMEQVRKKDILISYPYESIRPFIKLLSEAAVDSEVVSIKMTLYRLANNSKIIEALTDAAENGKEVVVVVELRARFDEQNNIKWSKQLEEAGCRIIYGLNHFKVHSKLCLITGKRNGQIEYITQIGTGNYNEKTAKIYTDYSLMTANYDLGAEAAEIFDCLAMEKTVEEIGHLLVAPNCMQSRIIDNIEDEISKALNGENAFIGIKVNSLTDKKIIDKLVEAGKAGVKVNLIVRGVCCLKAGIEGETDNISIISIVGRFLEHSRLYIFGWGDMAKVYIASADFMTRNMLRRVEVAAPVYDEDIKKRLMEDFKLYLRDDVKARVQIDGEYHHKENVDNINAQEIQYRHFYKEI